ncbi:MAG: M20 family peptidase [Thermodesulfobacteriota bacterium]
MKKILIGLGVIIVVLIAFLLYNATCYQSRQVAATMVKEAAVDEARAAARLSEAVRFKTISHQDPARFERDQFLAFHKFLQEAYPKAHETLTRETVSDLSLVYTWPGSEAKLPPIVFAAHMDVVPVVPGTEGDWTQPPFSGKVADGFVWGRGTLDDKVSLIGLMEAVEGLLNQGYKPRRTVILAFGHDEEVGGVNGAVKIAGLLKSRGIKADWLLDESGFVISGVVPGVKAPVAVVGISEKGYMTLELTVEQPGGHSSMPPAETAIGILSAAIARLEKNQFPSRLDGAGMTLFDFIGPEMPFGMKLLFANRWFFAPLIKRELLKVKSMAASLRTTIAPTIIQAGTKENVLPSKATATVNFRLMPGDRVEDVVRHVKAAIDDSRVKIVIPEPEKALEASKVSDLGSTGFKNLECTIRQMYPDALVGPYLVLGGTDARHYDAISDCILRFLPLRQESKDLDRIHGTNERVGVKDFAGMVRFYIQIIRNADSGQPPPCR